MSVSYSRWMPLTLLLALVSGCASSNIAKSEDAVESMEKVYTSLGKGTAQVNRTVALLDDLERGTDLAGTFKNYSAAVSDLKSAGEAAAKRAVTMREKRDEYLSQWETEAAKIESPTIKEGTEQRRDRVRASFSRVTSQAEEVRAAYGPFLQNVQDIQKALSIDLTPAGVKAIQPAITKAKADGKVLNSKLDTLGVELNALLGKIAPAGTR